MNLLPSNKLMERHTMDMKMLTEELSMNKMLPISWPTMLTQIESLNRQSLNLLISLKKNSKPYI